MLKAIHAQENKEAARKEAAAVAEELRNMKLKEAAKKVCDSVEETLTYRSNRNSSVVTSQCSGHQMRKRDMDGAAEAV